MITSGSALKARDFPLSSREDISAVGKVFAVTELLEQILQHLPLFYNKNTVRHKRARHKLADIDGVPAYSEPQNLFRVQRVNQMFNNTIKGSKPLRRLMFLEPLGKSFVYPDAEETYCQLPHYQRSPLYWFCDMVNIPPMPEESVGQFSTTPMNNETLGVDLHRHAWSFPAWQQDEASWRQIRLTHYEDSGPISIRFHIHARLWCSKSAEKVELKYTERRAFAPDATLGNVCDEALKIDERSIVEAMEAIVKLVDGEPGEDSTY